MLLRYRVVSLSRDGFASLVGDRLFLTLGDAETAAMNVDRNYMGFDRGRTSHVLVFEDTEIPDSMQPASRLVFSILFMGGAA